MATTSKKSATAKTRKSPATPAKPATPKAPPVRKAVPVPPTRPASVVAEAKAAKPKKPKLVRDSFTIPKNEYTVLDELKQRAIQLAHPAKKSELLRAGIKALTAMSNAALLAALKAVPAIKTGRPKKV